MANATLPTIDYFVHVCVLPMIIVFGIIGNISNIYIFTRPSLYRSCSIYFLAGAVNGLILLLFGTTSRWLGHTFPALEATQFSLFFCRFRSYIMNVVYDLAPYFIACVTVDRYCSSSSDVRIRRLSARPQIAYAVIIIIILMTVITYIHSLMFYTIIDSYCQPQPGTYSRVFSSFTTIYYFTSVLIIMIFGLGTAHNVRVQQKRVQPMVVRPNHTDRRHHRNDNQLLLILLVHVACYVCFGMPYHVTLIAIAVEPSIMANPKFMFIQHLAIIVLNFSQAIDCYVFTFTASAYRKELILLLRRIFRRPRVEQTHNLQMSIYHMTTGRT